MGWRRLVNPGRPADEQGVEAIFNALQVKIVTK
jgi:hypothetical protein